MARYMRRMSDSGYYHIMLRGNERKNIFLDEEDKQRFLDIMYDKKQGGNFYLHAFCLMSNHVHMMISMGNEELSKVMKKITVTYVSYFNRKYKRVGHLFQDRFRSEAVEDEGYLLALSRYIHLNPVQAGLVGTPLEYKWSSYRCYVGNDPAFDRMLDIAGIMSSLAGEREKAVELYKKYVQEENMDDFDDIREEAMDEERARELYLRLLKTLARDEKGMPDNHDLERMIRDFREETGLSIRKIAEITGLNKDRINRMLR